VDKYLIKSIDNQLKHLFLQVTIAQLTRSRANDNTAVKKMLYWGRQASATK